jgi:predicted DNA-binding protein
MPRKRGRPRVPKSKSRHVLIAVRLAQEEAKRLQDAVAKAGKTQSEWIRETLLAAA